MPNTPQSHSVDVLVERVTRLVSDMEGVRDDLRTVTNSMQRIPVMEHELVSLDKKMAGAFKAIDEAEKVTETNTQSIVAGKTMYKVLSVVSSTALTIAIIVTGWAWSKLSALDRADQDMMVRIVTLEVKTVMNADHAKQAEKLDKQGWVRDAK